MQSNAAPPSGFPPALGGGLIEAIFGGAAREPAVPRAYQPEPEAYPSGYQPAPAGLQQASVGQPEPVGSEPPQGYAPSSQGDMAHQPVDPKFDRQLVDYQSTERPGTIVIDTPHHFLFLVEDNGKALRYGIGVGRPGFTWEGVKTVTAKKEWPDWYPPSEMIQRRPDLPRYMAGGPENPLGARAMYLGSTLYRIHGSNEPWTIGQDVSSGCIRLRNADVIDLYNRVSVGAKVVVM
jgi:lipoprotein-anchoring transpeptidase ErfK/SrfK